MTVSVFKCSNCNYESSAELKPRIVTEDNKCICPKCRSIVKRDITILPDGKGLTIKEYIRLLTKISKYYPSITHVSHEIDLQTKSIMKVVLNDVQFSITGDNKHRNLKDWINTYLEGVTLNGKDICR